MRASVDSTNDLGGVELGHPQRRPHRELRAIARASEKPPSVGRPPRRQVHEAVSGISQRTLRRRCAPVRSIRSTRVLTRGGGRNAARGIGRPASIANSRCHRLAPGESALTHLLAAWSWATRVALRSRLRGWSSRRSSELVTAKGGLATTWNGRRGSRRSPASASTTMIAVPKRRRRCWARSGCASTAMTRAPDSRRSPVSAPVPAPTSRTHDPDGRFASSTRSLAQPEWSSCHPQLLPGDTTAADRDEEDHDRSVHQPIAEGVQRFDVFQCPSTRRVRSTRSVRIAGPLRPPARAVASDRRSQRVRSVGPAAGGRNSLAGWSRDGDATGWSPFLETRADERR